MCIETHNNVTIEWWWWTWKESRWAHSQHSSPSFQLKDRLPWTVDDQAREIEVPKRREKEIGCLKCEALAHRRAGEVEMRRGVVHQRSIARREGLDRLSALSVSVAQKIQTKHADTSSRAQWISIRCQIWNKMKAWSALTFFWFAGETRVCEIWICKLFVLKSKSSKPKLSVHLILFIPKSDKRWSSGSAINASNIHSR